MVKTVVSLQQVQKSYRLGRVNVRAVENVDLDLHEGDFVALAGPSGSGKTTLLNLIGCIDKPSAGRIMLNGRDVTETPLHKLADVRRKMIGFVFQTFNLIPVLTAFENVEYPLLLSGGSRKQRHDRVWRWLERVGLKEQGHQRPDQLSGGQRQRVAIARALITDPILVLADEPTANLDSATAGEILNLMSGLNRDLGSTFIFATHDSNIISRARRRISLRDGQVTADECNGQLHREGGLHAAQDRL
jgi:putative ABC transport system ATP-binding protein